MQPKSWFYKRGLILLINKYFRNMGGKRGKKKSKNPQPNDQDQAKPQQKVPDLSDFPTLGAQRPVSGSQPQPSGKLAIFFDHEQFQMRYHLSNICGSCDERN